MPLVDLIYRCPLCGADAMKGEEARVAKCTRCGREYEHVPESDEVLIREGDGTTSVAPSDAILDAVGGPEGLTDAKAGEVERPGDFPAVEASAVARFATEESAVRYRGALMGFVERRGPSRSGTLRVDGDRVEFVETAGGRHVWPLLDLRAVQTASSSVQISPLSGGVVTFKLLDDSPRRWEELLRERLRVAWRHAGRGEIVEFQSRIRTE